MLSLALFFSFISFFFTWQDDQSTLSEFANRNEEAKNLLNKFGASVSHFFMYKGFGLASFIFPFLLCLTGLYLFLGIDRKGLWNKWIWGLVFLIWTSIALGFFAYSQPLLGGLVGYEMNDFLQDYTGKIGVLLLLIFGLMVILVRLFKFSPEAIGEYIKTKSSALKTDFKTKKEVDTAETIVLPVEEETPIVIDTYTHKEDIPPLHPEKKPAKAKEPKSVEEDVTEATMDESSSHEDKEDGTEQHGGDKK